jgi:hypothetical protein
MEIKECTLIKEVNEMCIGLQGCIRIQHDNNGMALFLELDNLLLQVTKKEASWIYRVFCGRVEMIVFSCK